MAPSLFREMHRLPAEQGTGSTGGRLQDGIAGAERPAGEHGEHV